MLTRGNGGASLAATAAAAMSHHLCCSRRLRRPRYGCDGHRRRRWRHTRHLCRRLAERRLRGVDGTAGLLVGRPVLRRRSGSSSDGGGKAMASNSAGLGRRHRAAAAQRLFPGSRSTHASAGRWRRRASGPVCLEEEAVRLPTAAAARFGGGRVGQRISSASVCVRFGGAMWGWGWEAR